jgi:hypothetical protein
LSPFFLFSVPFPFSLTPPEIPLAGLLTALTLDEAEAEADEVEDVLAALAPASLLDAALPPPTELPFRSLSVGAGLLRVGGAPLDCADVCKGGSSPLSPLGRATEESEGDCEACEAACDCFTVEADFDVDVC